MIATITRLVVAVGYILLTYAIAHLAVTGRPSMKPSRLFLAAACALWAGWFAWLGIPHLPNPSTPIIQAFSRALHVPLVTAVALNVWSARRDP